MSGSSPSVQYGYDSGASGSNQIRPSTLTYPNGRAITYSQGTSGGMSDYLNRVDSIQDTTSGTTTLASYTYLGAGTVIRITYPEPSVWLDLWGGTSGVFAGIDRFGRIIDQRWQNAVTSTPVDIDRYQYGYDRNGNRIWKANVVGTSAAAPGFDELYAYDALNRLTRMQRGVLSGDKSSIGRSLGVSQLRRWVVSGNSDVHVVKLADAVTGIDLPGASVSVDTSGATAGQYLYGSLGGVAVLQPSHGYYLMSQEANAGDQWYDQDTTLTAAGDLTIDHAAWYDTSYHSVGGSGASYVPPNFIYGASQPAATGQTLGTARNNFPGWVGFRFTTTAGSPARQMDWTLDPTGNWSGYVTQTAGTTDLDQSRTSNPVNEITGITESTGPTWVTPAYDAAGNMTTMPQVSDPTQQYVCTYDAWNRLVSVSTTSGLVARYGYDGRGFRILKQTHTGGTTQNRYFYYTSDWQEIEQRIGTSTSMDQQHVWGVRYIDELVCRDDATPMRLYAAQDANFNVTALVNTSGSVQQRFVYDPYGRDSVLTGIWSMALDAFLWSIRFTARDYDQKTAIYLYRTRHYNFQLAGFLSRDNLGYIGELNLYGYVLSSPVMNSDPFGQAPTPVKGGLAGAIGILLGIGSAITIDYILHHRSPTKVTLGASSCPDGYTRYLRAEKRNLRSQILLRG